MDNRYIAQEWRKYAEQDLASADYLLSMRPLPIEVICYHCQQSAEKNLKAYIASNGEEVTKTHDLVALNKICFRFDSGFSDIIDECVGLTDFGVQVRYPFQLDLSESDVKIAIISAKRIEKFVSERLG